MSSPPPDPPQNPSQDADWRDLVLPEALRAQPGAGPRPDLIAGLDLPGSIPGYEAIDAKIEEVQQQIGSFTTAASALTKELADGVPGAADRTGPILDQARAWVSYLSPDGALGRAIPPDASPTISIKYLAQIAGFQRLAQTWVDYLQRTAGQPAAQQAKAAHDEQSCLGQIDEGAQQVNAHAMEFTLNSGNMNSYQMQNSINDLNGLLARLQSLRPSTNRLLFAGHSACSDRLEPLIVDLQGKIRLFQGSLQSRRSFEASQGFVSGPVPPFWP